jgi:hypothetical protein
MKSRAGFFAEENDMTHMTELPPKLKSIADKVAALRNLTKTSGFRTEKSQRDLLMPLSPDELALVAEALYEK